ncbi:MAG: sulfite exporter TauE/SafE family protein [Geminicoccaceae bacterium]
MDIYLPIAEMSVDLLLLIGLGGGVGLLSGLFGVGGGFLMTPLLIFVGIPAPVAVASQAPQILASSVSAVMAHLRNNNVDIKMGAVLTLGGFIGSAFGVALFDLLSRLGQLDLTISLLYVILLTTVGSMMFVESLRAILAREGETPKSASAGSGWSHRLPLKMRFPRSRLYVSALLPVGLGMLVGVLSAIMGVGGGFLMLPAMIYLLGMPTGIVIGTSLFQICFVMAVTTLLHAVQTQTVDIVLALTLTVGGVVGAQFGSRFGARLRGEQIRILLAILVLSVSAKLAYDLIARPADRYTIEAVSPF